MVCGAYFFLKANFEKFDRDRSGKIDTSELREALMSLGFAVSPVVLDLLVSKFDKSGGKNKAIEYDNFIEYVFPYSHVAIITTYCIFSSIGIYMSF